MDFQAQRDALAPLCATLSGLVAVWEDQPRPYIDPTARGILLLSLLPVVVIGTDEIRITYDENAPLGQEMTEHANSLKRVSLQVRCECYEQTNATTAQRYLETLRGRLKWSSSRAVLNAVNMARIGSGDIVNLNAPRDGRIVSIAVLEIKLGFAVTETDTANPFPYINSVGLVPNLST